MAATALKADPQRPWKDPRGTGDWSVHAPAGPASDTATSHRSTTMEIAGTTIPMRRIADVVDDVGAFADDPAPYELAMESVKLFAGPDHPMLAYLHVRYARFLWRHLPASESSQVFDPRERVMRALPAEVARARARVLDQAVTGESVLRDAVRMDVRDLSDADARRLAIHRETALDLLLSVAARGASTHEVAVAWDTYLRSRAIVLDELGERRQSIAAEGDSSLAGLSTGLAAARSLEAELSFAPLTQGPSPAAPLAAVRSEIHRLERELAVRSARLRERLRIHGAGLDEVIQRLAPGDALVAFAYYRDLPPGVSGNRLEPLRVLAFVLAAPASPPSIVSLGDAGEIDGLADRWRQAVGDAHGDTMLVRQANILGDSLRRRVWDPVVGQLRAARRVFIVDDGALQLVNLSALPVEPEGREFVLERSPVLAYLGTERDLVRDPGPAGHGLLAIGGADYGPSGGGTSARSSPCTGARAMAFPALPLTAEEVAAVASAWRSHPEFAAGRDSVRVLVGRRASERAFRSQLPGRLALHAATHGFFLGDTCPDRPGVPARALGLIPPRSPVDDPLLRSGIAFAGANEPSIGSPEDDGILTSSEIASLDLAGVRSIVLSACETALGATLPREGVLGLRRAFVAAGAGVVISSLWPADDRASFEFMRDLYDARFARGEPVEEAMRDAALSLLHRRRRAHLPPSPADWGAFLAIGVPSRAEAAPTLPNGQRSP